ncbi:hypothetical protein [Rhizobium yanglingense]
MRWPPESVADLLLLVAALEVEGAAIGARVHFVLAELDDVVAGGDLLPDGLVARRAHRGSGRHSRARTVSPMRITEPLSGLFLAGDHA